MNWTLGVPLLLMAVITGFLVWHLRPQKKKADAVGLTEVDFSHRHPGEGRRIDPEARDPLDNSPLGEKTVNISVLTRSGKIVLVRVNMYNADIVKRQGLGAFPNFRHNLEQYGRRHSFHYRRYFQPEYYYVMDDGINFDPIMWWIYYDIFFGYDLDSPAFAYDPQVWPDMQQEYQEKLESLPEQDDPVGLGAYLMTGSGREEPSSFRQEFPGDREAVREPETPERVQEEDPAALRDYLSRETGPAPQTESPREEVVHNREEDPAGLGAYVSRDAAEVKTHEAPEIVSTGHEESAAVFESHEVESHETVDVSPCETSESISTGE
jgi:hypothetical protein